MKSGNEWMNCISFPTKQEINSSFQTLKENAVPISTPAAEPTGEPTSAPVYTAPPAVATTSDTLTEAPPSQGGRGQLGRGSKLGATALTDAYKSQGIAPYKKLGIAPYHTLAIAPHNKNQGTEALLFPPVNNLGVAPLMNPPVLSLGTAELKPKQGASLLKKSALGELQAGSLKKQGTAKLDLTPQHQSSRKQGVPNVTMTFPEVDTSPKPFLTIR
jgi:hypothetical protein